MPPQSGRPARLARAFDLLPVPRLHGELTERRVQLDLGGEIAYLLGDLERLAVGLGGSLVIGLRDLEVVAEGEQGADRFGSIRLARERHGALQVLARLLRVSDPPEDPAEDSVGATRRPS